MVELASTESIPVVVVTPVVCIFFRRPSDGSLMADCCSSCTSRFHLFAWRYGCDSCKRNFCYSCCQQVRLDGVKAPSREGFLCDGCFLVMRESPAEMARLRRERDELQRQYDSLLQFSDQLQSALRRKSEALDHAVESGMQVIPRGENWATGSTTPGPTSEDGISVGPSDLDRTHEPTVSPLSLRSRLGSICPPATEEVFRALEGERRAHTVEREGLRHAQQLLMAEVEELGKGLVTLQADRDAAATAQQVSARVIRSLEETIAEQAAVIARLQTDNTRQKAELDVCFTQQLLLASRARSDALSIQSFHEAPPRESKPARQHHR